MDIFDKYVFTSDGTWFVKGSRVFMDYFHPGFVCPYGIRLCEENEPGGYKNGEYRFDEEMCVIDEFYVNGISCSDMDLEELEKIGEEYNSEIKKYTKEEAQKILDKAEAEVKDQLEAQRKAEEMLLREEISEMNKRLETRYNKIKQKGYKTITPYQKIMEKYNQGKNNEY